MNIDAQTLAFILLGLRVIAVILISAVLWKQIQNIREYTTKYPAVRVTVLVLTIVLLIGQFIPITLDTVVSFFNSYPGRHRQPNLLSTSYALNNAIKDVVIGALLAFLWYHPNTTKPPTRR